jgi:hypothetical protein
VPGTNYRNASASLARRRRSLEIICLAVEGLRARQEGVSAWTPCWDGSLGPKLRVAILKECLRSSRKKPGSWSVDGCSKKIFAKLESVPIRKSGPRLSHEEVITGGFKWNAASIRNFLDLKNSPPEPHGVELADHYAEVVADAISDNPKAVADAIKAALSSARTIEDAVEAIMEHAQFAGKPRAFAIPTPWLSSSFQTPPNRASAAHFLPAAEAAWKFLTAPGNNTRVFFVRGDPYSGKKTVLKHFIEKAKKRLPVGDEVIPLFAASLADLTSAQLIEQLYKFYLSLPGNAGLRSDIDPYADEDWKLHRIRFMANRQPACVLLADTDQSESDHTFGAISQDCSAEVLAALAQGHPDTRLLATAVASANRGRLYHEALLHDADVESFDLRGHFPISEVLDRLPPDRADATIDGRTWKFALITKEISRTKWTTANAGLSLERERLILARDVDGLATLVWRELLSPLERALLGLISISHDGLRASVLLRLVAGLGGCGVTVLPDLPELSEGAVEKALGAVGELLHKRQFQAEPALVRAGYLVAEPIYWLDQDWRLLFLKLWWHDDPSCARLAHWFVAREAAAQSRRLRVYHLDTPATSSFGRDIQTLHALIASIDPDAVISPQNRDLGPLFNLEARVLPPLEVSASYPDPAIVLRYCFMNLYRRDIEGKDYRLLTIEENAYARLGILLPLFTPSSPWLVSAERRLENDLGKHGHLKRAFEATELIDLLANVAIAAERLRRYDLIAMCAELGRQIISEVGILAVNVVNYMRLLRSQIDAHLFLGRANAAVIPNIKSTGGWLYPVARRIEELLADEFAPAKNQGRKQREMVMARGKLFARLGEAYHVLGRSYRARVAFARATESEEAALVLQPVGTTLSPVLGGRGARRQIRFLLEQARRRSSPRRFQHFIFQDGVALPAPIKVRPGVSEYRNAQALHDVNARRSHRGRAEDAVGLKIDAARLAAARHEFGAALEYLDLADASVKLTSGISAELLLEFYAVRARLLLDACILCLIANSPGSVFDSRPQLLDLVRYLGMPPESEPIVVAERLAELTRGVKRRFESAIDTLSDAFFPYATYSRYLEGVLAAAESRIEFAADRTLVKLTDAQFHLSGAVEHMRGTDYRMHLHEALRVLKGVDAALASRATANAR